MNCPFCGNEMEKGYFESRDGIGWDRKKRLVKALACFFAEQPLGRTVIAYKCDKCRKIVIDINESEE